MKNKILGGLDKSAIKSILDIAGVIILVIGKDQKVLFINKEGAKVLGYSIKYIIGKNWFYNFLPQKGTKDIIKVFKNIISGKITAFRHYENYIVTRDGEERMIAWHNTVLKDKKGKIYATLSSGEDITIYKKNEASIRRQNEELASDKAKDEIILQSIGDGLIVTDENEKVIRINNAYEIISGQKSENMVDHLISEVCNIYDKNKQEVPMQKRPIAIAAKTGKPIFSKSFLYQTKDGAFFPVAINAVPYKLEGKIKGVVALVRDISREVAIDRAKTEFVSLASHQLRTPLSAINWLSEMLMEGLAEHLRGVDRHYIEEIYHSNQRMVALVNALLNVSRIESGSFAITPKRVKFKLLIKTILEELSLLAKNKSSKIRVECPAQLVLNADEEILRIIMNNLISNAIKYTASRGEIRITVRVEDNQVAIRVKDNGIGIPREAQDKIFTKFFRADNAHSISADGTGLGLFIVKSIVSEIGGRIWFESQEGKGTAFYVFLPKSGMPHRSGDRGVVV